MDLNNNNNNKSIEYIEIPIENIQTDSIEKKQKNILFWCYNDMFLNFFIPYYLNDLLILPIIIFSLMGVNSIKYNHLNCYTFYLSYLITSYFVKLLILIEIVNFIINKLNNDLIKISFIYLTITSIVLTLNTYSMRKFIKYYQTIKINNLIQN